LSPAGQQVPSTQLPLHVTPQPPQLFGSVKRSVQPEGQRAGLPVTGQQADGPLVMVMHPSLGEQALPQLPQLSMDPV
jgi:hypothetical protein